MERPGVHVHQNTQLGQLNRKEIAALVGVAPMNRESGAYKGKRKIRGGRYKIRTVLFMAMMSAIQSNPKFKAIYTRLVFYHFPLFHLFAVSFSKRPLYVPNAWSLFPCIISNISSDITAPIA